MMKRLFIASALVCTSLLGQSKSASDSLGTISIVTEPSGADLYIDSMFVGRSPLQRFEIGPGMHTIRAFYPSVFAWNAVTTRESLEISGAEHQEKRLTLGEVLQVQSDPPDGIVRYGSAELGKTPLFARLKSRLGDGLTVLKEGYDSLCVPAGEINSGFLRLQLMPQRGAGALARPTDVLGTNGAVHADHSLTYASGAAMIVSGVASAYLKDRANRNFDSYLQTNNPSDLSATRRLDRGAAVTLIVSQISFAFLAYFLLAE